ncbi:uncharacterized protein MEPE_01470 [Melanopsichium pennsylvanicum]|uniref:DH domain-containing protein n=2 Tax=Melanopsichium pennsylvanicum TaxID=63383 RepID=A0AAJ4XHN9_9BASI|nr:rho guanyl-nucleotide exchange factor [Melanopsichium pennsylvanicum 4]SNX82764.1 uncharacterized protein MEPE_01470 [Melanopsichium pennsylvanicum]
MTPNDSATNSLYCEVEPSKIPTESPAASGSSSRLTKMDKISTAIVFPSSSHSSVDTYDDDARHGVSRSSGSSSIASPAVSTPRATSPDQASALHSRNRTTAFECSSCDSLGSPVSPASESTVPVCMAGLALQVQSAVSRNVTGPLVQVLTDAEEASALHQTGDDMHNADLHGAGASGLSSRTEPLHRQGSGSSDCVTALSSPDPASRDVASRSPLSAMFSSTSEEAIGTALGSASAVNDLQSSSLITPKSQERDSGSSEGSGTDSSAAQTDISRTPSTSTTGSSHAGSLDTAISSIPSGTEFETNYKSHVEERSADTFRVEVGEYDSSVPPSQASPVSLISEGDAAFLEYPGLIEGGAVDSIAEAKFTTAKIRRYAALLELVDTERNYADDLATLVLVFFDNLCMMPFFNDQPARQALVMRNSEDLLRTHQKLSAKLEGILIDLGLRKAGQRGLMDDKKTELEKALSPQADEAVVRAAKLFNQMMPQLQSYKAFCSRHGEALALIREAEKRQTDWDAFERHCADILKLTRMAPKGGSRPASGANTPSVWSNSPSSYLTPMSPSASSALASGSTSTLTAGTNSGPGSAAATPNLGLGSMRQNSSRLLFRDFLIKPIQRLCLYPLVLQTLQKHSSAMGDSVEELALAISLMREVADQVDEAGKRRESELRADLISSRIEPNQGVSLGFIKSLGDCQLSGTLDVLHHHRVLNPLVAPLRFKYFGVFVYHSFLLMVKVRKNSTYECRHWFPLWAARLSNVEEERNLIPHSFRLSVKDHHFELAASNTKERQLWIDMLSLAISRATFSPPGTEATFPCSLYFGDAADGESLEASEAQTPNASRPSEFQGYFDAAKAGTVDPLMEFLAMHAAGAAQATGSSQKGQRISSGPWMPTEILLRHASSNSRAIVDRGMVLSDSVISARIARDGGALSTLYAASGSGIGSAVGSSLGLSRLGAKETSTVKIQRRKSCADVLENADAIEDPNNLVFTATFVQPSSRSRSSTRVQLDDREGWKSSLLKKANRVRPASIFAPTGLSINTELGSPTWTPGSVSTPTSPVTASRDLPVHEFGTFGVAGSVPLSPISRPTSTGPGPTLHSLTSSPISGPNSAANSTVNLRSNVPSMPPRSRPSLYGMKDSLTMTFGRRTRTRSAQEGFSDNLIADFGALSAQSLTAPSPLASNLSLPHGEVVDSSSQRPSMEDLHAQQQKARSDGRSRTNSISSVTGSLRRVFTTASLAPLNHKRAQSDAVKSLGGSAQSERQLAHGLPTPLTESAPSDVMTDIPEGNESPRKTGFNTLRRSRTMLNYSRNWFRASAAASEVQRVNAEAVSPVHGLRRHPSSMTTTTASSADDFDITREAPKPLRTGSAPVTRQTPKYTEGFRRASDTQLTTISELHRDTTGGIGMRRASRGFNPLRFLQNNRLSPLPSRTGA